MTYLCQADSKFDFTDSMKRVNEVYKTTKDVNTAATYTDYRQDEKTKTWQTEGNTFDLGVAQSQPYDTCSKVCKTRKPKQDTQATQSGITSQYRKDITTYDFYYRQCYPSATVCPAVPVKKSSRTVNVLMSLRKRSHCWRPSGRPVRMQYVHRGRRNEKIFYHHHIICVGCSGIRKQRVSKTSTATG